MNQGLQRVLNLAKKTGDNVIVFDSLNPERSYVILAINKYEDLLEEAGYQDFLTEEEMTDKISRDIEPWDTDDWNLENMEDDDFLPKNLFDNETEEDQEEKAWEEDINYLYPTEDEFTSLRAETDSPEKVEPTEDFNEETGEVEELSQFNPGFSSIGELLEEKKTKGNVWEIPEERQV